jgi:hypothetical protein
MLIRAATPDDWPDQAREDGYRAMQFNELGRL